jgi:hypothetical protein
MESQTKHAVGISPKLQTAPPATPDAPDAPDASDAPTAPAKILLFPTASIGNEPVAGLDRFPSNLPRKLGLVLGQTGHAYAVMAGSGNPFALPVGSRQLNNIIHELGRSEGVKHRKGDAKDINSFLQAQAEIAGITKDVFYRVAPISGGIEIDLGDDAHTRARITAGKVEKITRGSEALFYRTQASAPMVMPASVGNVNLLKKYLNMDAISTTLFIAWLSYTLAHPKVSTSKFVILVLQGNQGSGKTSLCNNIILRLIDPSLIGVQVLPGNAKDLAIAAQNAHVLCYDNVREFKQSMSDMLCIAATGGALTGRQLYSDADQHVVRLHVALVLNGLHSFIDQPDLAQRCLPIQLQPLPEDKRKSETELVREFEADAPVILRGLLDLIADVFKHLPTVEVTNPERMIDFVRWLAAMEKAAGISSGIYQPAYSDALNQGQLDSILDNALAATVTEFAQRQACNVWSGTPGELFNKLNELATSSTQRSREWPPNPIALSKRLVPLKASLLTQGITVEIHRGKHRKITITTEGKNHAY